MADYVAVFQSPAVAGSSTSTTYRNTGYHTPSAEWKYWSTDDAPDTTGASSGFTPADFKANSISVLTAPRS